LKVNLAHLSVALHERRHAAALVTLPIVLMEA
jgi:hypothetical protein